MKQLAARIANLKTMIALEEKRVVLQGQIAAIDKRLAVIQDQLYGAGALPPVPKAGRLLAKKGKRKGRGELTGQILEMLQAVGKNGASVKEIAGRIGVKDVNVHSWFSVNLKKLRGLKKIGAARYALTEAAVLPAKKQGKKKAEKKAAKQARKGRNGKRRALRGQLKEQILNELKNAGPQGISIKELAAKVNSPYKNVYIWFVTTGKRIAGIKKIGPAQYTLEAAA